MGAAPLRALDDRTGGDLPEGWRFEDPPETRGHRVGRDLTPLLAHPGRWVLIESRSPLKGGASSLSASAKKRYKGSWSARTAANKTLSEGKTTYRLYLRYNGAESDPR